ncbi:hypothetical protein PCC9214_00652 [Planktothrix tepida]|uniref:Twin-arginine translocation pathway signal n=1 Tax=Planktothrix tepida PCC 9214 TaxID=671072 RepID=A0A1J1LFJ1_9CYAN|nr:DUF1501 domain-containing protein [Planktothrix tepida]CAD5920912.1 hypothetical protein PCC9214_00652 [Planktothrix tepida]CUR30942.1 conserved hypothetical protein [Planktothrix tepida PCC 9214]
MERRQFLKFVGLVGTSAIATLGTQGWVAKSFATSPSPKRLIVIFLRGGIDGLNVVVPYAEPEYYAARPVIAIPKPGTEKGVLDLDGFFGIHPALSPLMPLWKQGNLAFIHAVGSPISNRSHFEAQDQLETGTPNSQKTPDGWMNRLLGVLPGHTPVEAVSVGTVIPRILSGSQSVANITLNSNSTRELPIDGEQVKAAFDQLYASNDALSLAYREGRSAREQLLKELDAEMEAANQGAPLPKGFAGEARQLASLLVRDPSIQLAFMALGGWDTHINQGAATGVLANRLNPLAEGLAVLVERLGEVYRDTTVVVMSEFGRTVHENGNGGTDHGYGNVMWLLGGAVQGGKVYGKWPGLAKSELFEQRDLKVTTDFREVIAQILLSNFKLNSEQLLRVFPNFTPSQTLKS